MKFRYYVVMYSGAVFGTEKEEEAHNWAESEDNIVIDTSDGTVIEPDKSRVGIGPEYKDGE